MNELEKYYNKFNEDKRLKSRHGQVEFFVTMKYIMDEIGGRNGLKVLDIGAGTGAYATPLSEMGHFVTAVELVRKNLSYMTPTENLIVKQGNAKKLKLPNDTFDITLVFGPLYHLMTREEKLQAISEAKRVTKSGGTIMLMYLMNDYAVISYALKEGHLLESVNNGKLDKDFQTHTDEKDLYSYVRINEIDELMQKSALKRKKIIAVDGPTDYIRPTINKMTDEEFEVYKQYVLSIAERSELLGASSHVLDITKK